jgi:hypothetical protein
VTPAQDLVETAPRSVARELVPSGPERLGVRTPAGSTDAEPSKARDGWTVLAAVLAVLPAAALAELLLVRTFYRVGVFIPKRGAFPTVYGILTGLGSFLMNLSSVLATIALVAFAWRAYRRGRAGAAAGISAFLFASALAVATGSLNAGPSSRLFFALAVWSVAWPFLREPGDRVLRVAVAAVVAVLGLSMWAGLVGEMHRLAPGVQASGGAIGAQLLGEALVVMAAFLLLAAWVRGDGPRPWALFLGGFPALALIVSWQANGSVTGILALWTAGLRLYLPIWLYVLALWAFASAAIGWLSTRPWRGAGLVLLLVGGILLESTYLQLLAVLAVVLVTDGLSVGGLPALPIGSAVREK